MGPKLEPCWGYVGHKTLKKATSKTKEKKDLKSEGPAAPASAVSGSVVALNNTENPVQATIPENTPSQLALWRI